MSSTLLRLSSVGTFAGLSTSALAELEARLAPITVKRGATLVEEGDPADTLFIVVSGRFAIEVAGAQEPVAEISAGSTIGEIAFFTGLTRTATARAIRDSLVVALSRADFDEISARTPALWRNVTASLAARLAAETRKSTRLGGHPAGKPRPRTIALVRAGPMPLRRDFTETFVAAGSARGDVRILTPQALRDLVPGGDIDGLDATRVFNDIEDRSAVVVFLADEMLTPWSEKAMRQADEIVFVGDGDGPFSTAVPLNELEAFATTLGATPRHRLVLVHSRRGSAQGTRHWLAGRPIHLHHHVQGTSRDDAACVWRFLSNEAVGFVACGGGAYCAAHIGLYKAFRESGVTFDLFVGTSGGAAMAAAFAQEIDADEIDARVHRMFIDGKAMQRYTLPRYSVLDHTHFDRHLMREYGTAHIEDLWRPYAAVSMDLADYALEVHRTGPVWSAIRASAAIPALLPPYYTGDGRMLVDGSVIANVPLDIMRSLKSGPNVVVTFSPAEGERFQVDYAALPARSDLIWKSLNPWSRTALPEAPSASTVLIRSLMANRNHFERQLTAADWLLMPPTPLAMGALDWRRHRELMDAAYRYGLAEISRRKSGSNGLFRKLF